MQSIKLAVWTAIVAIASGGIFPCIPLLFACNGQPSLVEMIAKGLLHIGKKALKLIKGFLGHIGKFGRLLLQKACLIARDPAGALVKYLELKKQRIDQLIAYINDCDNLKWWQIFKKWRCSKYRPMAYQEYEELERDPNDIPPEVLNPLWYEVNEEAGNDVGNPADYGIQESAEQQAGGYGGHADWLFYGDFDEDGIESAFATAENTDESLFSDYEASDIQVFNLPDNVINPNLKWLPMVDNYGVFDPQPAVYEVTAVEMVVYGLILTNIVAIAVAVWACCRKAAGAKKAQYKVVQSLVSSDDEEV